jgi:hypothetical protein
MFDRRRPADVLRALALCVTITVIWCLCQNRLTIRNWRVPLPFAGDGLMVFAFEKAAAEGNFLPLWTKLNPHFGAPYVANWNDFPFTEDPLWASAGLISKFIGIFAAANLLVLLAQVLAASSFFAVCRALRCRWQWAFLGALAFGLAPYAFRRGLDHLGLTYYWHIPLCLLVCGWCWSRRGLDLCGRKFWIAVGVALITGIQNLYYTNLFVQFLAFAGLAQVVRRQSWRKVLAPVLLATVSLVGVVLMNLDTICYQAKHGLNLDAAIRYYANVEQYALKPLDLFIPPPDHASSLGREIAFNYASNFAKKALVQGELFFPYLGLLGIGAFAALCLAMVNRMLHWPPRALPIQAASALWVMAYSVIGGANGFLGQLGFNYFRCTNRYSIYILALVLMFGVKQLSHASRSWHFGLITAIATALAALALWDQVPPRVEQSSIDQIKGIISSDRAFATEMEENLFAGAMIFQLPVMRFPETPPVVSVRSYEHFRPYLHTRNLHYSYGDDKGRGRDEWQFLVESLPASEMIGDLEKFGFAAVYINRKGYDDRGASLIEALKTAGRSHLIESSARDLVCIFLNPSRNPVAPPPAPTFKKGWYPEERNGQGDVWHCSKGDAELVLHNDSPSTRTTRIAFELASPSPRTVELRQNAALLYRSPILTPEKIVRSIVLQIPSGLTTLSFKTEPAVRFRGIPDTRLLGFLLYNLRITNVED